MDHPITDPVLVEPSWVDSHFTLFSTAGFRKIAHPSHRTKTFQDATNLHLKQMVEHRSNDFFWNNALWHTN